MLELLKNVESHAVTLPKDGHALALAAGLPSLSAAFSGSPVISGILGSPQFLKWSVGQTTALAERIDQIRRSQTSVCHWSPLLLMHVLTFCLSTDFNRHARATVVSSRISHPQVCPDS